MKTSVRSPSGGLSLRAGSSGNKVTQCEVISSLTLCVCKREKVCLRACVCACMRACVHVYDRACVYVKEIKCMCVREKCM